MKQEKNQGDGVAILNRVTRSGLSLSSEQGPKETGKAVTCVFLSRSSLHRLLASTYMVYF